MQKQLNCPSISDLGGANKAGGITRLEHSRGKI